MAKLIMNVGGMFSGKSTELQKQGQRHLYAKQNVVFLKPIVDDRYSDDEIVTHDGKGVKAINIEKSIMIPEVLTADVVLIDEIQFFPLSVCKEIQDLLNDGINIYVSGLDMNYRGRGFLVVEELMSIADEVHKLKAVCEMCGEDAGFTGKRKMYGPSDSTFKLGEKDIYIPLCRECFCKHLERGGTV